MKQALLIIFNGSLNIHCFPYLNRPCSQSAMTDNVFPGQTIACDEGCLPKRKLRLKRIKNNLTNEDFSLEGNCDLPFVFEAWQEV